MKSVGMEHISLHDAEITKIYLNEECLEMELAGIFLTEKHPLNTVGHNAFAFPAKMLLQKGELLNAKAEGINMKNPEDKINNLGWSFEILKLEITEPDQIILSGWWWSEKFAEGHCEGELCLFVPEQPEFYWNSCIIGD